MGGDMGGDTGGDSGCPRRALHLSPVLKHSRSCPWSCQERAVLEHRVIPPSPDGMLLRENPGSANTAWFLNSHHSTAQQSILLIKPCF